MTTARPSWDYAPRSEWAASARDLAALGIEWPEPLARQHLRYLQAGVLVFGDAWPSLTELASTFGWRSGAGKPAVKRVRLLLTRWESWTDPEKADAWGAFWPLARPKGTTRARRGHDRGTTRARPTPKQRQLSPTKGTTRAR